MKLPLIYDTLIAEIHNALPSPRIRWVSNSMVILHPYGQKLIVLKDRENDVRYLSLEEFAKRGNTVQFQRVDDPHHEYEELEKKNVLILSIDLRSRGRNALRKIGEYIFPPKCIKCDCEPDELMEYRQQAQMEGIEPVEWVKENEGTYDKYEPNKFYCTSCYIKAGLPL